MLLLLQVSTQLYVHAAGNPLLNYLKGLEADSVKSLTIVSEDALEAINTFIHRLLGEHIFSMDMHSRALTCCNLLLGLVARYLVDASHLKQYVILCVSCTSQPDKLHSCTSKVFVCVVKAVFPVMLLS